MASTTKELGNRYLGLVLEGRYRLEELIGHGGMGAVFRGMDERLRRQVAVKVIQAGDLAGEDLARHRQRFTREAQLAARIQDPNVVTIHDYGTHVEPETGAALDFIVMDLLRGESLAEWLPRLSRTDFSVAFSLLMQTAQGVAAGHREGVVHRDVKPRNVLVVPGGKTGRLWAKVVDFGIARPLHDDGAFGEITVGPGFVGTASYASPEQLQGRATPGPASDVFSLGLVACELFTGTLPFTERDRTRLSQGLFVLPQRPRVLNPGVPPAVEEMILQALALDPADRYEDADAFASALDEAWRRAEAAGPLAVPAGADETLAHLAAGGAATLAQTPLPGAETEPVLATVPASEGEPPAPLVAAMEKEPAGALTLAPAVPAQPASPSVRTPVERPAFTPPEERRAAVATGTVRTGGVIRRAALWVPAAAVAAAALVSVLRGVPDVGAAVASWFPWFRSGNAVLMAGTPVAGEIGPGDRKNETDTRYDVYRYRATETGPLVATMQAYGFNASLQWGRMVDGTWTPLESSPWRSEAWLVVAAEQGAEYLLRVQSQFSGAEGTYTLSVASGAPGLNPGDAFASTLTVADARLDDGGYAEEWAYRGAPGDQVTVMVDSTSGARLEWGRVVGGDWIAYEAAGEGESQLTATAADSGEYRVRVRTRPSGAARTAYTVSMASGARQIRPGQSRKGRVSPADAHREGGTYEVWSYRGTPDEQVTFTLHGLGVWMELGRFSNGRWQVLERGVVTGDAVQITAGVDTSAYLLRTAADVQASVGTPYHLSATTTRRTIAVGQTRRSVLSGADPLNPQNRYHETWTLRGTPEQWLRITATGAAGTGSYGVGLGRFENGTWAGYGIGGQADWDGEATLYAQFPDSGEFIVVVAKSTPNPDTYSLTVQRWP